MRVSMTLALAAMIGAPALAQVTTAATAVPASIASVLATALPSSLLAMAATDPAAVSNVIASEFAAGKTPDWFRNLPAAVQTFLVPALATASPVATPSTITSTATLVSVSSGTGKATGPASVGGIYINGTIAGGATPKVTASPSATPFNGAVGKAEMKAVVRKGLLGVMGLAALFAL